MSSAADESGPGRRRGRTPKGLLPKILVTLALLALAAVAVALGGPLVRLVALPATLVLVLLVGAVVLWRRPRRVAAVVAVASALAVAAASGWYWSSLHRQLSEIPRVDDAVLDAGPRPAPHRQGTVNFLLLGADDPAPAADKPSIADLLAADEWSPGAYRSDTIVVVHIPRNRASATVVSIPRDSYLPIVDPSGEEHAPDKVNAAFSSYGPFGTWRTVESLAGVRLDHMAILDFEGFRDLTTALGGVEVRVPETVRDPQLGRTWEKGTVSLEGQDALDYVRMRYGLENGDFDRVRRQQNFLRAVVGKLGDDGTTDDPRRLLDTVEALAAPLTVDEGWTSRAMASLALSVGGIDPDDIHYVTLPFDRYERVEGAGAVNIVDKGLSTALFRAMRADRMPAFLDDHPELELPDADEVR